MPDDDHREPMVDVEMLLDIARRIAAGEITNAEGRAMLGLLAGEPTG